MIANQLHSSKQFYKGLISKDIACKEFFLVKKKKTNLNILGQTSLYCRIRFSHLFVLS